MLETKAPGASASSSSGQQRSIAVAVYGEGNDENVGKLCVKAEKKLFDGWSLVGFHFSFNDFGEGVIDLRRGNIGGSSSDKVVAVCRSNKNHPKHVWINCALIHQGLSYMNLKKRPENEEAGRGKLQFPATIEFFSENHAQVKFTGKLANWLYCCYSNQRARPKPKEAEAKPEPEAQKAGRDLVREAIEMRQRHKQELQSLLMQMSMDELDRFRWIEGF